MAEVQAPTTPTSVNGRFLSKANVFFKSSVKRIANRTDSISKLGHESSPSDTSRASSAVVSREQTPEAKFKDVGPFYTSRGNSSSSPSLFLQVDEHGSPVRPLRHTPSFPNYQPTHRPLSIQPRLPIGVPLARFQDLAGTDAQTANSSLAPAFELQWSPPTPTYVATMEPPRPRHVDVSEAVINYGKGYGVGNNAMNGNSTSAGNMQNPSAVYQHIHEICAKRVSTLDYLRKAHRGQIYWFNTLLFSKADLSRMPSFDARRLAKRATNYLLLGLSLPIILDLNTGNPMDFLRALNALLLEFETYQQVHPTDGSASSLSRAKIPQMFKRSTYSAGSKGRRTSSAADIGLPMSTSDPSDLKLMTGSMASAASSTVSFGASEQDLLPGEQYTHLLTPSLPFDPDFFETFATLCDVLIDCYGRITQLVPSPAVCVPALGDLFVKADGRLRKVIVSGIVKEFEDASRGGVKNEMAGIGKVVLGGLI